MKLAVAKPSHATLAHQVKVAPPLQPISNKLPLQVASAPQLRAKTHATQNTEDSLNATLQERPAQRMLPVETVMLVKVAKVEREKENLALLNSPLLDSPFSPLSSSEIIGPLESAEYPLVLRTDKLHLPASLLVEGSL